MANIRLTKIDLSYLLHQVHVGIDYTQLFGALDPSGVREVNGANNNLVGAYDEFGNYTAGANPLGGMTTADTNFLRLTYTVTPGQADRGTTYPNVNPNDPMQMGSSVVFDPSVRLITNLITSSVIDPTSPVYNPAAVAAMDVAAGGAGNGTDPGGHPVDVGNTVFAPAGTTGAFIGDQGVLGGATFNEFFTAFGQFFDHGLDFISKGGGFVAIPLSPNDPLYIPPQIEDPNNPGNMIANPDYIPGASNIMYLNRASLTNPASDFNPDGTLREGVTPTYNNNTGYLVDQSQTYGSHASVNAVLRQYDADGRPTGLLITSAEDGNVTTYANGVYTDHDLSLAENADLAARAGHDMATWADLKANALRIGVVLQDSDVLDLPALRVDATGTLLYIPNGTLWTTDVPAGWTGLAGQDPSDPFVRHEDGTVVRTNQPILADMGLGANPAGAGFDPNALAIHYVSGDGRVNENVGLTAVHHVFHEEHNYEAQNIMNSVLTEALTMQVEGASDAEVAAYINDWTRTDHATVGGTTTFNWTDDDGIAHSLTVAGVNLQGDGSSGAIAWNGDSLYQAARIITEQEYNHIAMNDYVRSLAVYLPEFVSYGTDVHPNISLEFSQAIFRLGHSMLTEQFHFATMDANGRMPGDAGYVETFDASGTTDLFDAFLNPAMYQDMGPASIALGLLRGQASQIDEFVTPALQQTLVGAPLDLAALNIARGRDVGLPTLNELREQVYNQLVAYNQANSGSALAPYTSWQDFGANLRTPESLVNFIAAYARDDGAHHWGLTEARAAYQAGTATLADVRAVAQHILDAYHADPSTTAEEQDAALEFMEGAPAYNESTGQWEFHQGGDQGFWDIDLWIGGLAEHPTFDGPLGTTFTYIMLDFGERLLDGDRFYYFYRMPVGQHLGDELISHTFSEMIERTTGLEHTGAAFGTQTGVFQLDSTGNFTDVDANNNINDYFNASQHLLADGTPANLGHIVVSGGDGNDYIVGGFGDDYLYGDDGNDFIQGGQGNDNIMGGDGDDWIYDDENDDTLNGGRGNDHIFAGTGVFDLVFGGEGDDEVHGGDGIDEVHGDDGDDAVFGEGDTDLLMGGEGNDYMNGGDGVDEMFGGNGNDWMQGGVGDDNINGGSGNDLMEGGQGATANDGDRLNGNSPVAFGTTIIEWNGDGTEGDMDIASYEHADIAIHASLQDSNQNGTGSTLLDTYAFLEGLVGSRMNDTLTGADANTTTSNGANNYIIGGGGDDILQGLGGDDFIFGDSAIVDNSLYAEIDTARYGSHGAIVGWMQPNATGNWGNELRPIYADGTRGHVLGDTGTAGNDTVVFSGNPAEYQFELINYVDAMGNAHNAIRVTDTVADRDGSDVVVDVENFKFTAANQTFTFAQLSPPTVSVNDVAVTEGNSGSSNASFTISLDHAFIQDVVVTYNTSDGSAVAPGDYTSTSGTVTIPAGSTSVTVNVPVLGDTTYEANETFNVNLTAASNGATLADALGVGTINNDDAMPTLSITGASTLEGQSGTHVMTFTVTQSAVSGVATTVNWTTANGSASAGSDYVAASGTLTIPAGSTTGQIQVTINGDTAIEGNETFTVSLSSPAGATIAAGTATGTIIDDELNVLFNANFPSNTSLPGTGNLGSLAAIPAVGTTYAISNIVSPTGGFALTGINNNNITRTGTALAANSTYSFDITATQGSTNATETITIRTGTSGNDTITTGAGDTTVYAWTGNDTVIGGAGDDNLFGQDGNDTLVGGAGNDWMQGGAGTDTLVLGGARTNYSYSLNSSANLVTTDMVGTDGTDTFGSGEVLRFGGIAGTDNAAFNAGGPGSQIVIGTNGNDSRNGGAGDDIIVTGNGDDTITYNVNNGGTANGGHDMVIGGAGTDTFILNGNSSAEDFYIYSRDAFLAANPSAVLGADTTIVITRNGTGAADIINELSGIEEIKINTTTSPQTGILANGNNYTGAVSGDHIHVIGDFTNTGLAYNTITINGSNATDQVDITALTSDHRIVFNTNGGGDTVLGDLRPQDVVNSAGSAASIAATLIQPDALTTNGLGISSGLANTGLGIDFFGQNTASPLETSFGFHREYQLGVNANLDPFDSVLDRGHHFWS